ncbi:response regulator [Chitinibacter sp. SCUT-21]|uniref:response regulator n=1 Tax=Chitinibacter sp. SCUT-21 TaxID=2970891 RepID=UPI0035A60F4F
MSCGPILIVDDEPVNLAALNQILSSKYTLVFANSGAEALLAVAKHHPSLILLDVQMPEMSGYQVCEALKRLEAFKDIPVLFVTSLADVGNESEGFRVGAVDYLTKPVCPAIVHARVATHLSLVKASTLERSYRDAIMMLGLAGHYNDNDTGLHIWRMAAYSRALALAIGWSNEMAELLELAAPMHDTGKIGIPDSILKKPGKLTEAEWVIMRSHTTIGFGILNQSSAPIFQLAAEIALRHHERWDGSGYPDGLIGEQIPESARIVAICDVFDALMMKRSYKEPWPLERVMLALEHGRAAHFEPRLLDVFFQLMPQILQIKSQWDAKE